MTLTPLILAAAILAGGETVTRPVLVVGAETATPIYSLATAAQLRHQPSDPRTARVQVLGLDTVGDGGGGTYYWSASSTASDDGVSVIQPTGVTVGRWLKAPGNDGSLTEYLDSPVKGNARPPAPLYVEGFAGLGAQYGNPLNWNTYPNSTYSLTVTGSAGGTTLTRTGGDPITDVGTSPWLASVQHDDLTWSNYTVLGYSGASITITPPLRSSVTAKRLSNAHTGDTHYTDAGYYALANLVYNAAARYAVRERHLAQFLPGDASGQWAAIGSPATGGYLSDGTTTAGIGYAYSLNNFAADGRVSAVGNKSLRVSVEGSGKGVAWTQALRGLRGHLEAFVGTRQGQATLTVTLDGVQVHSQTITRDLTRVLVPYSNARTAVLSITAATGAITEIQVGRVTWWAQDAPAVKRPLDPFGKTVLIGDSWTQHPLVGGTALKAWQTELERLIEADSGRPANFKNVGMGGQTSEWGRRWFDTLVLPEKPDTVIIEFFTNDINLTGTVNSTAPDGSTFNRVVTQARWLENIAWMVDRAIEHGIQPIVVMPCPDGDAGVNLQRGMWSDALANGGSLDAGAGSGAQTLATTVNATYSGSPLALDLSAGSRFLVTVASGQSLTSGAITLTNAPGGDYEFEVAFAQEDASGNSIHPNWLANLAYNNQPVPRKRAYGYDRYRIVRSGVSSIPQVAEWSSYNPNAGNALLGTTLPTMTGYYSDRERFYHTGENRWYTFKDGGWSAEGAVAVAAKTANYAVTASDNVILVNATAGPVAIYPTAPVNAVGRVFTIKKVDASANAVTIDPASGTVDGADTYVLSTQYQFVTVLSDGSNYFVIGKG